MEKVDFDKTKVLDKFISNLRNKQLFPKPHLGVLETKFPEESSGTFTFSDRPASQNVIGYDFQIKSFGDSPKSISTFCFWVRRGELFSQEDSEEKAFVPIELIIESELEESICKVLIKNKKTGEIYSEGEMDKKSLNSKDFFKYAWEMDFPIKYKECGKELIKEDVNPIKITLIKNIKKEPNGVFRIQLRITNETILEDPKKDYFNIGIKQEDNEKYQKIPKGLLLDFSINEKSEQANFNIQTNRLGFKTSIKRLFNLVPQNESPNKIEFSEYFRGYETIPNFKEGGTKEEFLKKVASMDVPISKEIIDVYEKMFKKEGKPLFHKYQEEGIIEIAKELNDKKGVVNIISVRTAGGKTETFAAPLINFCYQNLDKKGVKALIFYPTKALANDQALRIFNTLYFLNEELKIQGKRPITMGIYHGDIKKTAKEEKEVWVPFKCPDPDCEGPLVFEEKGIHHIPKCSKCGKSLDYLFLTRYEIHGKLPDILITNQDTLNYTLMDYPQNHSIFGRKISYCEECGESFINKRVCPDCHKPLVSVEPQCSPEMIIMDEIHMLGGAFGMNTSLFMKRLLNNITKYSPSEAYKPTFVGATATIDNPRDFASKLFNNQNVNMIPADKEEAYKPESESQEKIRKREHLFILPRSYVSADTLSFGMQFILKYFSEEIKRKPSILGFCESIKDNRTLIKLTRQRNKIGDIRIDGHTSQFDRAQRAKIEKEFTKKEVNILYATSTLQVGVDFDDVNVLLLHGVPYFFNDYLQRIGRSGRKEDAAVITTLRKWNPLDYYYFEKCRFMLENPEEFVVDPPFNEKNDVILRNHIRALFFDILSSYPNIEKISSINDLKEFISGGDSKDISNEFKKNFLDEAKTIFNIEDDSIVVEVLEEFSKIIFTDPEIKNIRDIFRSFDKLYQIGQLRNADKSVEVIFQI